MNTHQNATVYEMTYSADNFHQVQNIAQDREMKVETTKRHLYNEAAGDILVGLRSARIHASTCDKAGLSRLIFALEDNLDEAAEYLT